jgi:hypothetical protein
VGLALALFPAGSRAETGDPGEAAIGVDSPAIRYNQLGYLPAGPKVAIWCGRTGPLPGTFRIEDSAGAIVWGPGPVDPAGPFGPCEVAARLDFSAFDVPGRYRVAAGSRTTPWFSIEPDIYDGTADFLLRYLRQQRSRWNPLFRDSVHHRTDGILVDHPRTGEYIDVAGGWADAADYLQYVTTSAHATFSLLLSFRDHPSAFDDAYDAAGLPGPNGTPDVLDEARWGLEWLLRMYPRDDLMLNQLGDDRDHAFLDLPTTDSSDYGWGRGGYRPVYPCTGRPQGLLRHRNRSDGKASTAGKMASAFALGAQVFAARDPEFADSLAARAEAAYRVGRANPGACQTAPAGAPYFYEEANWVDDMELAAAELHALTGRARYLVEALEYAAREPVTPWMGADTARHYEWYPWHNNGHYEIWRRAEGPARDTMVAYYRRGLEAVAGRASNAFRIGVPFIWCSNNLVASFATQAALFRTMTGDSTFVAHEQAAVDWLFGTNPWGTSMVIGLPTDGDYPEDPHSVVATALGTRTQYGGLVDGPVYRSIFENLLGIELYEPDEYAVWNTGRVVYHDDWGDYSTNEPIMDGTANLVYVLAMLGGT